MGCGQSKIHLYPRKSKSKTNGKKSVEISSAEGDEDDAGTLTQEGTPSTDIENPIGSSPTPEKPHLGVILPPPEVSSSQLNFFRMLDEKIESGRDYDSSSETELALEEARMTALVKHWESASLSASACSSTSQGTPVKHSQTHRTTQEIQITPQPSRIPLYPPVYRGPPEVQTSVREIPSTLSLASRSGHPENIQIAPHQRDVLISQFQNARSIPEVPKTKFDLTRINDNSFDESPNLSPVRHPRDQSNLGYSRDPIPTYSNVRNYAVQPLNAEYLEQRRNYVINVLPQSPVKTQRASPKLPDKGYNTNLLPQSVIHQSYGVNVAPARRLSQGNIPHCAHVTYYSQQMARIGPDGLLTPTNPPGKPTQPPQPNSAPTHSNYHSTQMLGYVNPSKFYGVSNDANQMNQRSQPSMSTFTNGAKLPPPIRQIPNDREQFFLDSNLCQNSQNIVTYPTNISNNLVNINDLNRSPRVQTRKADNSFSGEMS